MLKSKIFGSASLSTRFSWCQLRKSMYVAAAMLSILTVIAGGSYGSVSASEKSSPPGESDTPYLQEIADYKDISLSEAAVYIDREDRQLVWVDGLTEAELSDDGVFIEDSVLVVNATVSNFEPVSEWVTALIDNGEATNDEILVRRVEYGLQGLTLVGEDVDVIAEKYPDVIDSWTPNLITDRLDVAVISSSPDFSDASEELNKIDIVDIVDIGNGPQLDAATEHTAMGHRLIIFGTPKVSCTIGFPYISDKGDHFIITAGHCLEPYPDARVQFFTLTPFDIGTAHAWNINSSDIGAIKLNSEVILSNRYEMNGTPTAVTQEATPVVGSIACQLGGISNTHNEATCGEVIGVNYYNTTFLTDFCGQNGDSGSAVVDITGTKAYGIYSAHVDTSLGNGVCKYGIHEFVADIRTTWPALKLYVP